MKIGQQPRDQLEFESRQYIKVGPAGARPNLSILCHQEFQCSSRCCSNSNDASSVMCCRLQHIRGVRFYFIAFGVKDMFLGPLGPEGQERTYPDVECNRLDLDA